MNLKQTIDALIVREGGFVDHPNDKGGPTCWGITIPVARAFGFTGDIQTLSKQDAFNIYTMRFWIQPGFDKIVSRSPELAEELLDTGVNMGTGTATKFLQRALNVLNQRGKLFPDVSTDGGLGAMTLAALDAYIKARGKDGVTVLLRLLNAQQAVRYMEIAEGNPTQEDFVFGWVLNRVA